MIILRTARRFRFTDKIVNDVRKNKASVYMICVKVFIMFKFKFKFSLSSSL